MKFTTALKSIQEQRVTTLVENDNQQQIYIWVRKHLLLPSGRGHYTDWELRQSVEERIPEVNMRRNSRQLWCTKDLSKKLPECNLPVSEMFFFEAPVVSHGFR